MRQGLRYGAQRHGAEALRHGAQQGLGLRYNFYIVTGGSCDTACQRLRGRNDMAWHDHDTAGHRRDTAWEEATIRPSARTTTWRCERGLGTMCAQPGFRVCTLCTQPSLDSVHCFESLFGTLFMSTVHEVFKKIK